jgi:hypothetical protein
MKIDNSEQKDESISEVNVNLFEGVLFQCNNINDTQWFDQDEVDIVEDIEDCDLCGSHGTESVNFDCECGEQHQVVIKVW